MYLKDKRQAPRKDARRDKTRKDKRQEELDNVEELVVTRLWMAGVVGVMATFAAISAIGYFRQKSRAKLSGRPRED